MAGGSEHTRRDRVMLVSTPDLTVEGRVRFRERRLVGAGAVAGGWVRVTPVAVSVRRGDGAAREVRIVDPTRQALSTMGWTAIGIAVAGIALLTAIRRVRGRPQNATQPEE